MGLFKNKEKKENDLSKIIIREDGKINIEGNFNRDILINILRKELKYQEEIERLNIIENVKKDFSEKE